MDAITEKVKEYIRKNRMISPGDTVVAGISGGADSVCLLFLLEELRRELPFRLLAVHLDHMIREEAPEDAAYVESLCREMKIPFFLYREDIPATVRKTGQTEEEAGRTARYRIFREVLNREAPEAVERGTAKIAVAHNKNDRAETMLFQLFRGSGIRGLIGIRPVRECIIRPVLCLERKEIESYLAERSVRYCTDVTNNEDTYMRNKIRHRILPVAVGEICGETVEHMAQTADILLEAEEFLEEETDRAYDRCTEPEGDGTVLDIPVFLSLSPYLQKQVLFRAMEKLAGSRKDIGSVHIGEILELIRKEGNRKIHLPYSLFAEKRYDRLVLGKRTETAGEEHGLQEEEYEIPRLSEELKTFTLRTEASGDISFALTDRTGRQFEIPEENQYTKWFDYDKIKRSLKVRHRRTGDFLTIDSQGNHQTVKKYMIQEKIPSGKRDGIDLLADGDHIVWVLGYRISEEYKIDENTKHILKVQLGGN